jgi:hypothetical protein
LSGVGVFKDPEGHGVVITYLAFNAVGPGVLAAGADNGDYHVGEQFSPAPFGELSVLPDYLAVRGVGGVEQGIEEAYNRSVRKPHQGFEDLVEDFVFGLSYLAPPSLLGGEDDNLLGF